jgi:hypothetical protein
MSRERRSLSSLCTERRFVPIVIIVFVKYLHDGIKIVINICCIVVVNWFLIMFKCQLCSICLSGSSLEANVGIIIPCVE